MRRWDEAKREEMRKTLGEGASGAGAEMQSEHRGRGSPMQCRKASHLDERPPNAPALPTNPLPAPLPALFPVASAHLGVLVLQ